MTTKDAFHKLIDGIDNEEILKGYYNLIKRLTSNQTGKLWNCLTREEKEELLLSYEESFDQKNLIDHNQIKKQHNRYL